MDGVERKDEWVRATLGIDVQREKSREVPSAGRLVAFRTALLRWREAQGRLEGNLQLIGQTLLAHPAVAADPRLPDIRAAVAMLPRLVPTFGGRLEDVLDAGLNATEPAEQARLRHESRTAIDLYRQQLASASRLLELEQLAASDLGTDTKLAGEMDAALVDLKQLLTA